MTSENEIQGVAVSRAGVGARPGASVLAAAFLAILVAGCAGGGGGDPGARPLPSGETCQSLRGQLDRLLARGVQPKVEALSAGRSLSAKDRADAEAYNRILNQYLGARCHL
ncbi:MAG: hypothetical protein MUC37_09580 [Hyphomicrobium sp.]|jgi:hypothetical protein|nr:hypothetical protein [Hyphomicrobium sp.]